LESLLGLFGRDRRGHRGELPPVGCWVECRSAVWGVLVSGWVSLGVGPNCSVLALPAAGCPSPAVWHVRSIITLGFWAFNRLQALSCPAPVSATPLTKKRAHPEAFYPITTRIEKSKTTISGHCRRNLTYEPAGKWRQSSSTIRIRT
jgi:hypothetical protein